MKKASKWLSLILCIVLVFSTLAACSSSETTTTAGESEADTTAAETADSTELVTKEIEDGVVYNIGICQLVQHTALDAATQGFQDRLTELLGEDHVKFDLQNAAGDSNTCSTIVNKFVSSNVDLIMANATAALQAASAATTTIPVLGTSVTDYATALEMTDDWTGKTGINVSGTSDLAPLDKQADIFTELLPDAKTIGIVYCSGEANSKYQATVIAEYLAEKGLTTKEYTFADSNDIAAVVTKAVDECDALYIPTDNKAADNTEVINNIAEPANCPIIAGEEGICEGCGVATLSISYYDIGVTTAEMAYDILVNGADPADMDIRFAPQVTKEYVKDRAEALGITVPDDYTAIAVEEDA